MGSFWGVNVTNISRCKHDISRELKAIDDSGRVDRWSVLTRMDIGARFLESRFRPADTIVPRMAINHRTRFAYRIDAWDADGENVIEHLAGVEDLQVAKATYLAACQRWPGTPITLRQGTRVIEDSRRTRLV